MTRSIKDRTARTRRHAFRPRVDPLEDRQLLTAGALDTSFNYPYGYGPTSMNAMCVAIQSDGKIDVAGMPGPGPFTVARYNTDGTPDSTFGSGGMAFRSGGLMAMIAGLAIQQDGKIVVAGTASYRTGKKWIFDFEVARYNANGTVDTTFGPNHDGLAITSYVGVNAANLDSLVLQPDGKIVIGGDTTLSGFTVLRFDTSGNLDPTFGTNGVVTTDVSPGNGGNLWGLGIETVVVNGTPTTKIIASGLAWINGSTPNGAVVRYNLDGSLDSTFGAGGIALTHDNLNFRVNGQLAIQPDQKIIIVGTAHPTPTATDLAVAVARFNVDGSLDTTFNPSGPDPGIATVSSSTPSPGKGIGAQAAAVQSSDGKIIITGSTINTPPSQSLLARFNPDGSLDTTFASGGVEIVALSSSGDDARYVALQSDGKIVTANLTDVARFLNQAPTTTAIASSADPSVSGESVTFTATVSTMGTSTPTGTVQFFDGSTLLGTGTLSTANGVTTATFATTTLAVGTHSITAVYGGDSNDQGSTSAALTQTVNAATSTALVVRAAPSATPMTTGAASLPGSFIVPLALEDFDFTASLVGGKRRRSS
jgi:uncharacterized delta-60 repeat protein